ncbi:MAG: hypothetical protein IKN41_04985 [Candidatus Methanomethylophilaceae archaeon]|nr:hypothetical protein [Candidatus Methanomethylophilaceae archaeon]
MIECINCGRIPENGDLAGWQSKTIRSKTGAEFIDWWCPDCAEVQI